MNVDTSKYHKILQQHRSLWRLHNCLRSPYATDNLLFAKVTPVVCQVKSLTSHASGPQFESSAPVFLLGFPLFLPLPPLHLFPTLTHRGLMLIPCSCSALSTALPCPSTAFYSPCAPDCPETCLGQRTGPYCDGCREGCVCPPDHVWDNYECVPREQCGCVYDDQYYSVCIIRCRTISLNGF